MNGHLNKRLARICVICILVLSIVTPAAALVDDETIPADPDFTADLWEEAADESVDETVSIDAETQNLEEPVVGIRFEIVPLYVDGVLAGENIMFNDVTYIGLRAFCEAISEDSVIEWDESEKIATVRAPGLHLEAAFGEKYAVVNGRYLYVAGGIPNIDGNIMLPVRLLAKAYGVGITWNEDAWRVEIDSTGAMPIESADRFYDETDLLWLSRIINAESGNQTLEGKIAVGNVIMNRVKDPYCPDNIFDVIFDSKHGVQFTPTATGTIYLDPNEESEIAAKICLEGYNLVGDSLFFVNPDIGVTEWFSTTRTYVVTFGDHDFYA